MSSFVIKRCRADENGTLVIPLGPDEAGSDVEVTIRSMDGDQSKRPLTREEWTALIESTSGVLEASWERPGQPALPARDWND